MPRWSTRQVSSAILSKTRFSYSADYSQLRPLSAMASSSLTSGWDEAIFGAQHRQTREGEVSFYCVDVAVASEDDDLVAIDAERGFLDALAEAVDP